MGMDTNIIGIKPPDEKWQKMKDIWEKCAELKVTIPQQVEDFFDGETPDPAGVLVDIPHSAYSGKDAEGLEVEVAEIPKDVKILRFYNSF
jgi:hypothetical protein